jgi:hypothetical protein
MSCSSPAVSTTSSDDALFELLGIDRLSLDPDVKDEEEGATDQDEHDGASCRELSPPLHCLRPQTPHSPLLLETTGQLLSPAQCHYVIYNLGYRATNNGGETFGPNYVTKAQHIGASVDILDPNHHKVCVFASAIVMKWIATAFEKAGVHEALERWSRAHHITAPTDANENSGKPLYTINPRLRLLRYDARDQDTFHPHYDATTTSSSSAIGGNTTMESKITILLYLNNGGGVDFEGGNTLFLNAMQPATDRLEIQPQYGKFVLFNHELYHASQALPCNNDLVCDDIPGGTKFVLRSDIMFPQQQQDVYEEASVILSVPTESSTGATAPTRVCAIVTEQYAKHTRLAEILQQLDMDQLPVSSFLVPGASVVAYMLIDLGLEEETAKSFVASCCAAN